MLFNIALKVHTIASHLKIFRIGVAQRGSGWHNFLLGRLAIWREVLLEKIIGGRFWPYLVYISVCYISFYIILMRLELKFFFSK